MSLYQAHNGYQAISDGRIGGNPLVFVEAKNPCNPTLWYVPGTHHEDPLFGMAAAMRLRELLDRPYQA